VVAVVVADDPGPSLEETLGSLLAQDYTALAVVVVVADDRDAVAARVASTLPTAYVLDGRTEDGFSARANRVLELTRGASWFLFCHDDVVLDPDAVRLMVEEGYRSNAGIVGPKQVAVDDPSRLLHVGRSADKAGAVAERVEPGELDHGQHDAVRDVFSVPGGCMLVRADLFAQLGGFDPAIELIGEDLDLCWRAQVLGARVVVCPDARVRHHELLSSGRRGRTLASLRALERRHALRTVLKCYSRAHLLRVVPQILVLHALETLVALVVGRSARVGDLVRAWRWNLRRLRELRVERRRLAARRVLGDREVRRLQLGGSARAARFARRARVHGLLRGHVEWLDAHRDLPRRRSGMPWRLAPRVALVAVAVLYLIGARGLVDGHLPAVGQFLPPPAPGRALAAFAGRGTLAGSAAAFGPAPSLAILGVLGWLAGGSSALVTRLVLLGALPLGALGAALGARRLGAGRPAVVGAAYLVLPLGYDALARGDLDTLVCVASAPWVMRLLVALGQARSPVRRAGVAAGCALVLALVGSIVPVAVLLGVAVALAWALASIGSAGRPQTSRGRFLRLAGWVGGATLGSVVLLAPWLAVLLASRWRLELLGGARPGPPGTPGVSLAVRDALSGFGSSPLAWGSVAVAAFALAVARGTRLQAAWFGWALVVEGATLALLAEHGSLGALGIPPGVPLALVGLGLALGIGAAVAAAERDVRVHGLGWRQLAATVALAGAAAQAIAFLGVAGSGRFGLPVQGFDTAIGVGPPHASTLWVGTAGVVPGTTPGRVGSLVAGLASVGERGLPSSIPEVPGSDFAAALRAVTAAQAANSARAGSLLRAAGVGRVVVAWSLPGSGAGSPPPGSSAGALVAALGEQVDLERVPSVAGLAAFKVASNPLGGDRGHVVARATHRRVGPSEPLAALLAVLEALAWLACGVLAIVLVRRRDAPARPATTTATETATETATATASWPATTASGSADVGTAHSSEASGRRGRRFVSERRLAAAALAGCAALGALLPARIGGSGRLGGSASTHGPVGPAPWANPVADTVAPSTAESTLWTCPLGTGAGGEAVATLLIVDASSSPRHVVVTAVAASSKGVAGPRRSLAVEVPAFGEAVVLPSDLLAAEPTTFLGATVLSEGGGVGVEELLGGQAGWTAVPCTARLATRLALLVGEPGPSADLELALMDPTPTPAVADVELATDAGAVIPPQDQGVVVPAGGLVILPLSAPSVGRRVAGAVVTAASGELAAAALDVMTPGGPGVQGIAAFPAVMGGASTWVEPAATLLARGHLQLALLDPSRSPAAVTLRWALLDATSGRFGSAGVGASPSWATTVGPGTVELVDLGTSLGLPANDPVVVEVRARGAPLVVARFVTAPAGGPSPTFGGSLAVPEPPTGAVVVRTDRAGGSIGGSQALLLPAIARAGSPFELDAETLGAIRRLRLLALGGPPLGTGRGTLALGPPAPSYVGSVPLVLEADGPLAAVADFVPAGAPGVVSLLGLELPGRSGSQADGPALRPRRPSSPAAPCARPPRRLHCDVGRSSS
jgi:GT2 family glycosyltransferase